MSRHIEKQTEAAAETLKRLEARVAGRKAAMEAWELYCPAITDFYFAESFIESLKAQTGIADHERAVAECSVSEIPIARLGATEMPFGGHAGKKFDDVPLEYLDWLCRSQEDFYKSLRAYLRHPELESRRRGTD